MLKSVIYGNRGEGGGIVTMNAIYLSLRTYSRNSVFLSVYFYYYLESVYKI